MEEEQHRQDSEAPLLAASKPDGAASSSPPRNRRGGDERGADLHGGRPRGERHADRAALWCHQHLLACRRAARRLDLRPPRPPPHHCAHQRLLPRWPAYHDARRRVHGAHGGTVHLWNRRRLRARNRADLRCRDRAGLLPRPSQLPSRAHLAWRLMFAAGVVPTVFLAAGVLTMPESPRWLAMKGRLDEAKAVLDRTSDTLADAEQRLLEIEEVVDAGSNGGGSTWNEVATKAGVRRVLATVLALQFFQQASGIDSVVLYGPRVLAMAGVTSNTLLLGLNVLFGVAKAGSILIAMALADRVGRRPLLLVSTGGMTASLLVLGSVFAAFAGAKDDAAVAAVAVAAVVAFVCTFSVGFGPMAWVYSSEILPLRLRGQGAGLGTAMNRVMSGIVTMTFISLYGAITMAGAFYLYAAVAAASFVFIYTCLPETRGRNLEDMEQLFRTK
ncbi:polyol transporter 5-like isoform X3 [Triticum dicoccoides]|uniref:polyol transporter 5-like isoform X3 n=1 Tax=Triticum dicoccoides TaxID=85692 RepID=UPI00188F17C6|nr:polyol transporter 5-like isoform X3 [Triticum dicoccoides]